MEMTLNMGAFEALDNREMMEVDGGGPVAALASFCAVYAGLAIAVCVAPAAGVALCLVGMGTLLNNC